MGYQNANLVRLKWQHLPSKAFRALNEMAWCSMDDDDPPRYFRGVGRLAWAMGRNIGEEDEPSKADERAVSTVITQLVEAKAIERLNHPKPGERAVYALRLWRGAHEENPRASARETGADAPPDQGTHEDFPRERTKVFGRNARGFSASMGEEKPRPKEVSKEASKETREEPTSPLVSTSPALAAANGHPDDPRRPTPAQVAALRASNRRHQTPEEHT